MIHIFPANPELDACDRFVTDEFEAREAMHFDKMCDSCGRRMIGIIGEDNDKRDYCHECINAPELGDIA